MKTIIFGLLLTYVILAQVGATSDHHDILLLEDGMLFKQTVTEYDDLQVFEVPAHGDRLHIIAYLDFRSGLQLIKDVKNLKCQLSTMEDKQIQTHQKKLVWPEISDSGFSLPDLPIDASRVEKVHLLKLEESKPMANTSFLRLELQQACAGLPIYWADTINEADLNNPKSNGGIVYDRDQKILMRPMYPQSQTSLERGSSCRPANTPPPNQYLCHGNCVQQKCRMTSHSCYYFITCPMHGQVGVQCMQHALHMGGQCKMCCDDPQAPCSLSSADGFYVRCDCLQW